MHTLIFYLHCHLLGLLLYMLNNFIASASVVASSGRAVLLPFFQTYPAKIIFALQKKGKKKELKGLRFAVRHHYSSVDNLMNNILSIKNF